MKMSTTTAAEAKATAEGEREGEKWGSPLRDYNNGHGNTWRQGCVVYGRIFLLLAYINEW